LGSDRAHKTVRPASSRADKTVSVFGLPVSLSELGITKVKKRPSMVKVIRKMTEEPKPRKKHTK